MCFLCSAYRVKPASYPAGELKPEVGASSCSSEAWQGSALARHLLPYSISEISPVGQTALSSLLRALLQTFETVQTLSGGASAGSNNDFKSSAFVVCSSQAEMLFSESITGMRLCMLLKDSFARVVTMAQLSR